MTSLTVLERKALKARAHPLSPVVSIGNKGLNDAVVAEIDRALTAHELIKISARGLERDARDAALAEICARTGAQAVQHIGKILVVYRRKPDEEPPAQSPAGDDAKPTRTSHRGSRSASPRPGSAPRPRRRSVPQ